MRPTTDQIDNMQEGMIASVMPGAGGNKGQEGGWRTCEASAVAGVWLLPAHCREQAGVPEHCAPQASRRAVRS